MFSYSGSADEFSDSSWNFLKFCETIKGDRLMHASLPSGIDLLLFDFTLGENSEGTFNQNEAPIAFTFHITGSGYGKIHYSTLSSSEVESFPGKVFVTYCPDTKFFFKMKALTEYKTLNLFISPSRLYSHLDSELQYIPQGLASVLDGSLKTPFIYETTVSPAVRLVIDQLINSSYQGAMKRLFLESKSMELIVRQLYEISSCCGKCNCVRLVKGDIERIMEVRNILQNSIGSPPSLDELARRVGINITKLKQGFKSVFETTPYAFLRSERMRIAENMLKNSSFNITEISHQLGFSDTSHFIREFVKFYGTTPGRFIKNHS